jgi:hypothetical protein
MDKLRLQARALRRGTTDAERALWSRLRRRQLGGFRFRRQHPIDRYIADFVCPEARLIIELDGAHHLRQFESVGWPTPTGTLWPSLPQVPTRPSSLRSLPTIDTRVSTSGPLPISVAPLTGA